VLVSNLLPIGLRGLVLAGMLSALMSALASLFNSTATLFTVDFYKRLRPQSSEQHLVRVGRFATAPSVVIGMIWIPIMQSMSKQLYSYLQLVQSLLAPGIAAVFMAGIFLAARHAISGFIGLATGSRSACCASLAGAAPERRCRVPIGDPGLRRHQLAVLQLPAVRVHLRGGVRGKPRDAEPTPGQIEGLTYRTVSRDTAAVERQTYGFWEIFHTCVIAGIIVTIYVYFW
jgi:SSS family solute:Na+ symporter